MSAGPMTPQRAVLVRVRKPQPLAWRIGAALKRWLYLTLAGLVLGAMVHLATILAIPRLAMQDAVTRYGELGAEGKAERIDPLEDPARPIIDHDAMTAVAACGFDLTDGPLKVQARTGSLPLGISLQRSGGGVSYAITDRAAIRGMLEFVVLTDAQLAERIAREDDGAGVRELRVVSPTVQGLLIARSLAKRPADRAEAEALATGVTCAQTD